MCLKTNTLHDCTGDESPIPDRADEIEERPTKRRRSDNEDVEDEGSNDDNEEEEEEEEDDEEEEEEEDEEEDEGEEAEIQDQVEDENDEEEIEEDHEHALEHADDQESADHSDEKVADNDEDMPQAEAHSEEPSWSEAAAEEKLDSVNENATSNDSTMDVDSPNNDNVKETQSLENGYEIHQANGDVTNNEHIKIETVESERMLNEESLKVNGVNDGDTGMLTDNGNIQIFEDAKVSYYQRYSRQSYLLLIELLLFFLHPDCLSTKRKWSGS